MQRVHISPGKALCRFCGERVATNRPFEDLNQGPINPLYKEGTT